MYDSAARQIVTVRNNQSTFPSRQISCRPHGSSFDVSLCNLCTKLHVKYLLNDIDFIHGFLITHVAISGSV